MKRIVFDLDETLGTAKTDGVSMQGFCLRTGCLELLTSLSKKYELLLWSVSSRRYVDKALKDELSAFFRESYSWDELPFSHKVLRRVRGDYLIDDNPEYKEKAKKEGMEESYLVIPAVGSAEDLREPFLWKKMVEQKLLG